MGNVYQPEHWRDLYVMLGTSSAALIGLLFVATSLHLDEIANNDSYRTRARNNSYTLIFTLVEATIILTPQPVALLGGILVVANLAMLWFPVKNAYLYTYKYPEIGRRGGWVVWRAFAFFITFLMGITGGILIISRPDVGLYLVTAAYIAVLVIVALNSWTLMIGIGQLKNTAKDSRVRKARK